MTYSLKIPKRFLAFAALFLCINSAHALYECVDNTTGKKTIASEKLNAKLYKCTGQASPIPPPKKEANASGNTNTSTEGNKPKASRTPTPADFPKVDTGAQKTRDSDRKHILEEELAAEKRHLADAQKSAKEANAKPTINAEEAQKILNKAALHQRNIEAISRELAKIR